MKIPRMAIAALASGAGKTTIAMGLVRALTRRGLRVQTFKVGPDFLDPTHLALASGRPCYNLDGWMCGTDYVRTLFKRKTADADVAIVEGVMGLFDGASPDSIEGSTAEIARCLDLEVVLVVNARGMARTLAALVQGACCFEAGVRIRGVVANHCGSDRHADILRAALRNGRLPELLGAIPGGAFPELPSRHLGLAAATASSSPDFERYADVIDRHVRLDAFLPRLSPLAPHPFPLSRTPTHPHTRTHCPRPPTIAIARDDAFSFYYPDTLEALEAGGAQLIAFSPIGDTIVPEGVRAVFLGGGYPELQAQALAANRSMLEAIRGFAQSGGIIYAECGGMMYLSQSIQTIDGDVFVMTGLLPFRARMTPKRKVLGYVEATLTHDSLWGSRGDVCRGHEFHYSDIVADTSFSESLRHDYRCRYRGDRAPRPGGFRSGNILADYIHLHWASHPSAIRSFIDYIRAAS